MLLDEDDVDPAAAEAVGRGLSARELIARSDTLDPASEVNRAALLTSAAQFLGYNERHDDALVLYRAALADGGPVAPDARIWLADGLLKVGDSQAARDLFAEVHRDHPADPFVYEAVGESWEEHGDLAEAHRWFTLGWTRCEEAGEADVHATLHLLFCRNRVRAAQGLPVDDLGVVAEEYLYERRRERDRHIEASIQAFIPSEEWTAWPFARPPGGAFEEQVLLIERVLREDAAPKGTICVPLDAAGLSAYAGSMPWSPAVARHASGTRSRGPSTAAGLPGRLAATSPAGAARVANTRSAAGVRWRLGEQTSVVTPWSRKPWIS